MSNWSDFAVILQGKKVDIEHAFGELNLKLNDNYLVPNGYNDVDDVSIDLENDETIQVQGRGRWKGPSGFIKEIFQRHNLSGCYGDMEYGKDWCIRIDFQDGKVVNETDDKYFSDLSIYTAGISFMVERFSWIPKKKNWKKKYKDHIALFKKHGVPFKKLKQVCQSWDEITNLMKQINDYK